MANEEQLAILKQGVQVWNEWRINNSLVRPDLVGANLSGMVLIDVNIANTILIKQDPVWAELKPTPSGYVRRVDLIKGQFRGVDFSKTDLRDVNLVGATLARANLSDANIAGAHLTATPLIKADIRRAKLNGTNLVAAQLIEADLSGAEVDGTDFGAALMQDTVLGGLDLRNAKDLDKVIHLGPSYIDISSFYRSKGEIPATFLRGVGVPEDMIAYSHLLSGRTYEFYSCFISHSAKDKRFCERLYADLQAKGVRVWYFPEDAKWGETVWGEIDRGIKVYDKLIVVLSENSLQSGPVNREIERALNREDKEGKGILFPIRIDDYIFDTWEHERKADVVRKVVGDFSGWDKDAAKYEKAFDKLLKGLQAA